jgi:hypothetical protein
MPVLAPVRRRAVRSLAAGACLALAAVAPLALAGCRRTPRAPEAPAPATTIRVENRSFDNVVVYALRSSQRMRLGQVNANATATLRIPSYIMNGTTPLRFLADPIGARRTPISQEIVVNPGDEVYLLIPPR